MAEAQVDDRGRLYLPKDVRERYGDRFRLVRLRDGIKLVPVAEDPVAALRDALAPLQGVSRDELKRVAEEEARREAFEDLR